MNPSFDWFIFTDCKDSYSYPSNVHIIYMNLSDVKDRAEQKLGFPVCLDQPYKLCDFKPAYGLLFEDYIQNYEYWGHCDCDVIFGNLSRNLSPLLDKGYDKVFAAGHMTLYRNDYQNNRRFMKAIRGEKFYKHVFMSPQIFVFDEDYRDMRNPNGNNVHSIFLEDGANIYVSDLSFSVSPTYMRITRTYYDPLHRTFCDERFIARRYYWENGNLFSLYWDINTHSICREEYLYMHLQMRPMRYDNSALTSMVIEILPNRFRTLQSVPHHRFQLHLLSTHYSYWYRLDYGARRIKLFLETRW